MSSVVHDYSILRQGSSIRRHDDYTSLVTPDNIYDYIKQPTEDHIAPSQTGDKPPELPYRPANGISIDKRTAINDYVVSESDELAYLEILPSDQTTSQPSVFNASTKTNGTIVTEKVKKSDNDITKDKSSSQSHTNGNVVNATSPSSRHTSRNSHTNRYSNNRTAKDENNNNLCQTAVTGGSGDAEKGFCCCGEMTSSKKVAFIITVIIVVLVVVGVVAAVAYIYLGGSGTVVSGNGNNSNNNNINTSNNNNNNNKNKKQNNNNGNNNGNSGPGSNPPPPTPTNSYPPPGY